MKGRSLLSPSIVKTMDAMRFFYNTLREDDRLPVARVNLFGEAYDIFLPSVRFWTGLCLLLVLHSVFMAIYGIIIYKIVVRNRGKAWSYIFGYLVVIPTALYTPFLVLTHLKLQNHYFKMTLLSIPTAACFRCLESMHGTSPDGVQDSLRSYLLYCTTIVEFQWDKKARKRIRCTESQARTKIGHLIFQFFLISILSSWLIPMNFQPFECCVRKYHVALQRRPTDVCDPRKKLKFPFLWELMSKKKRQTLTLSCSPPLSQRKCSYMTDLIHPGHLFNNFLALLLVYLTLSIGLSGASLLNHVQGYLAIDCFRNPFLTTKSPSDFWGRRWNMVAHGMLKRGVFQPLRKVAGISTAFSSIITFLVSGLLHDYGWLVIHYEYQFPNGNKPAPFQLTAFFVYCTIIVLLERPVMMGTKYIHQVVVLPQPIQSLLVITTFLPVAHWFTGDLLVGGYYRHFAEGLLLILPAANDNVSQ